MILIKVGSVSFTLPLSDEALYRMDPEEKLPFFLPLAHAQFEIADMPELTQKLPQLVRVDEMNMLAYILQQCDEQQLQKLQESVRSLPKVLTGDLLNRALAVCPEAAGFPKDSGLCPLYTGENIFDPMEYKRYQDWKREYPNSNLSSFTYRWMCCSGQWVAMRI